MQVTEIQGKFVRQVTEIQQEWDKKNATLRSLGLRTMSMQR